MKKRTKLLAFLFAMLLVVASLTACGNDDDTDTDTNKEADTTDEAKEGDEDKTESADEIYFLNFKPEIAEVYDKVAADYKVVMAQLIWAQ